MAILAVLLLICWGSWCEHAQKGREGIAEIPFMDLTPLDTLHAEAVANAIRARRF